MIPLIFDCNLFRVLWILINCEQFGWSFVQIIWFVDWVNEWLLHIKFETELFFASSTLLITDDSRHLLL